MEETRIHRIKLASRFFDDVEQRRKNFEVRYNDRDYRVLDWLVLCEWDGSNFTGRMCTRRVSYLCPLSPIGLDNWVAMGIE